MKGKALWSGLKSYLGALVATILFPLVWAKSLRIARRHSDADPRATAKVGIAMVVSLVILAGGAYKLYTFEQDAKHEMYASLEHVSLNNRIKTAVGETEYQDNVATIGAADVAIPIIERNLANATDEAKKADLQKALQEQKDSKAKAEGKVAQLTPNHQLFERLQPPIMAHDDAAIRREVSSAGLAYPAKMSEDVEAAFAMKDKSVHDMTRFMWLFLWPSLFGAFFAPVVLAVGSVLGKAFVPSDTVGFKVYPGGAAGLFLLFGAFGLPAVPFAAWVFLDLGKRSEEGQIAL